VSGGSKNNKALWKLPNGTIILRSGHAWKGQLSGGGEEIRDVLLSGAVVVAVVCEMAKNPSFVHHEPLFKGN
jgi:hypothetical protein